MRDMSAGELQNPFPAQCVLERLLADDTFAAGKRALAARVGSLDTSEHAGHVSTGLGCEGDVVGMKGGVRNSSGRPVGT